MTTSFRVSNQLRRPLPRPCPGCLVTWHCPLPLLWLLAILLLAAPLAMAEPFFAREPTTLAELTEEALFHNQDLQAMAIRVQALRAEAPFAGSLQDPMVTIGMANLAVDTFRFNQEAMTQKVVAISQRFPWFGKLDLAEQAVLLSALKLEAQYDARRLQTVRQVRLTWFDLAFNTRRLTVNQQLEAMVQQVLRVAETRYATGIGLQQDILTAQVQLSELLDEKAALTAERSGLEAEMGSLLNRTEPFQMSKDDETMPLTLPLDLDQGALIDRAISQHPLVRERLLAVELATNEIAQAHKAYLPDWTLQVGYGQREDTPLGDDRADLFSAAVSFTVPLWQTTRQDSKLAAAEYRRTAAQRALAAIRTTLPHRIEGVIGQLQQSQDSYRLFQDAVTVQAGQLAESSLAAYSVGKVEFATMLSAHTRSLRLALRADEYRFRILKKLAELDALTAALPAVAGE